MISPRAHSVPVPLPDAVQRLDALATQARGELASLAYPDRAWVSQDAADVTAIDGVVHDVLIIGGGQSGLAACAMLRTQGVYNVAILDRASAGSEGVWDTFARMPELRTPKQLNGIDLGVPALGVQHWYTARFGAAAWSAIDRVPRMLWMDYLRWYRATLALPVVNDCDVQDIAPASAPGLLAVRTLCRGVVKARLARLVVLATGSDGAGAWRVPDFIAAPLPAARCHHSSDMIDFSAMQGARVGVLGHGASAFDNAVAALQAGARSVDLCFRRAKLPRVNPHRYIETAGFMTHYPRLPDATRWQIAQHFRRFDQPPPRGSFYRALAMSGFNLHAGCGWQRVRWEGDEIQVDTPHGTMTFDHVICATGQSFELDSRPELVTLAPHALRWGDRYVPPSGDESAVLAAHPYLGEHYEFLPRGAGASWLTRVFAFNSASYVSQGPHSTSISGHKHALPRLVRGLTQRLFLDQSDQLMPGLARYDERELELADDFEASFGMPSRRPHTGPSTNSAHLAQSASAKSTARLKETP